eukprot:01175_4
MNQQRLWVVCMCVLLCVDLHVLVGSRDLLPQLVHLASGVGLAVVEGTGDGGNAGNANSNSGGDGGSVVTTSFNDNHGLLAAIREVVVASAHVVESAGILHLDESTIEIRCRSSVELHAVLGISLKSVVV